MAKGINNCTFIGHLGGDPELRYAASGTAVCGFSIACSTKRGENEHTEWVSCKSFNRLAEICSEYLKKGSSVYVRGRIQTNKWKDKNGADRQNYELLVDEMQMLSSKSSGQDSKQAPSQQTSDFEDEIPF